MALGDIGFLAPQETNYAHPGAYDSMLKAEAAKTASYLSSMDQFYAGLKESQRQFDETLELKEEYLLIDQEKLKLEREAFGLEREKMETWKTVELGKLDIAKEGMELQKEQFGLEKEKLELLAGELGLKGEQMELFREQLALEGKKFEEAASQFDSELEYKKWLAGEEMRLKEESMTTQASQYQSDMDFRKWALETELSFKETVHKDELAQLALQNEQAAGLNAAQIANLNAQTAGTGGFAKNTGGSIYRNDSLNREKMDAAKALQEGNAAKWVAQQGINADAINNLADAVKGGNSQSIPVPVSDKPTSSYVSPWSFGGYAGMGEVAGSVAGTPEEHWTDF